jgi:hypothetical protein
MPQGNWQEVRKDDDGRAGSSSPSSGGAWVPIVAGAVVVALICVFFPVPRIGSLAPLGWLVISAGLVLVAIAFGLVAAVMTRLLVSGGSALPGSVRRATWLAAIWAPAWIFALHTPSVVTVVAGCILMAVVSLYVRRFVPAAAEEGDAGGSGLLAYPFAFDSKALTWVLLPSLLLAVLLEATGVLTIWKGYGWASLLAGVSIAVLVWRVGSRTVAMTERRAGTSDSRAGAALLAAFCFTLIVLLPYLRSLPGFAGVAPMSNDKGGGERPRDSLAGNDGYTGIILLSPNEEHKKIVAPVRKDVPVYSGRIMQPIEIPFDGAYWYFKAPDRRPRPSARVVHGSSMKARISSTDRYPLLMEAHQKLDEPIDLGCCSGIEIVLLNADKREGAIALELWVRSVGSPELAGHYLGTEILASSTKPVPLTSDTVEGPVEERLEFLVSSAMEGIRFDEIKVVVRSAPARARVGAQIGIRKFVLEP